MKIDRSMITNYSIVVSLMIVSLMSVRISIFMYISQTIFIFFSLFYLKQNRSTKKYNQYLLFSTLFLLFSYLSILWSKSESFALDSLKSITQIYIIANMLYLIINNDQEYSFLKKCFIIAGWILLIYILIVTSNSEWKAIFSPNVNLSSSKGRLGPSIGMHANMCGCVLSIFSIFALDNIYRKKSFFSLLQLVLFVFCLMLTKSRSSILITILGFFIYFSLKSSVNIKKILETIFIIIIGLFAIKMSLKNEFLYSLYGDRIESLLKVTSDINSTDDSTLGRIRLIKKSIEIFKLHPLIGVGIGNFSLYNVGTGGVNGYYAHNNYLELLADLGIIGFLLYYLPYIICLYKLKRTLNIVKLENERRDYILLIVLLLMRLVLDISQVSYLYDSSQIILVLSFIKIKISNQILEEKSEKRSE